jgi:CO dehydrogenase/acetyl-CoA synthase beta subunit
MIDKNELYSWVDKLTTEEQATVFDFVQFLVDRRDHNDVKKFYESVPETDEPFTEEELRQMNDNTGWVDWEVLER